MTDIEQALAEALVAYRVDGKYQLWEYADHAEEFFGSPQELARGMAATEPMQTIARQAAIGAAVERLLWSKWGGDFRIEPTWRDDEGGYLLALSDGREFWSPSLPAAIAAALKATR